MLENIIKQRLQDIISDTFGTYYTFSFKSNNTSLSPAGFSIGFNQIKLTSDTTNKYMMSKYAPVFFEADKLAVNQMSILQLLFGSEVDFNEFILDEPNLVFIISEKDSLIEQKKRAFIEPNQETAIKKVQARNFQIRGGSAAFVFAKSSQDTLYAGKDLNVLFEQLEITINKNGVQANNVLIEDIQIEVEDVLYNPRISSYKYKMDQMSLNYVNQKLLCQKVDLIPKRTLYALTLEEKYQKTIFDISIGEFHLNELDFDSLKNYGAIRASKGLLKNAEFTLLRNANHPLEPSSKRLMNESLARTPFPVDIDTLFIENALIDYRLVPKGKKEEAQVSLRNIHGHLSGIYNENHKKDTLQLSIESDFMQHGQFSFVANFPLHGVPAHHYHGHIGQLPFTDLNAIVNPMVGVELKDGLIEDIYFTGQCSDRINQGEMIFDYDNLKLQVNSKKKKKRNWLLSDVGNLIVRHKSKKDKNGQSKAVSFYYERPVYQGHIGFYLNGLLDGIMKNLLPNAIYKAAIKGMTPKAE